MMLGLYVCLVLCLCLVIAHPSRRCVGLGVGASQSCCVPVGPSCFRHPPACVSSWHWGVRPAYRNVSTKKEKTRLTRVMFTVTLRAPRVTLAPRARASQRRPCSTRAPRVPPSPRAPVASPTRCARSCGVTDTLHARLSCGACKEKAQH